MNDGLAFLIGKQAYFTGLHAPQAHLSFHGRVSLLFSLTLLVSVSVSCVVVCDDKSHLTSHYATPSVIMDHCNAMLPLLC